MKRLKTFHFLLLPLTAALLLFSCKKDPKTVPAGNVSVKIYIAHHSFPIAGARVFLKKNTTQFPGTDTTQYDFRQVCDENGYTTFTNLGNDKQDLYFYVKGEDPNFAPPALTPVWGYRGLTIVTKPGEDHAEDFYIYVSE